MKRVPRNEGLFLFLVFCAVVDLAQDCNEGAFVTGLTAEEFGKAKPGDRGPLATSDRKVTTEDPVAEVFVVRVVSTVLVDAQDRDDECLEGKESDFEGRGTWVGKPRIGEAREFVSAI